MSKCYLIDPIARAVTDIEADGYQDLLKYMPGGITIGWSFDTGDVIYVDDEGLLRPIVCAFRMKHRLDGQPYVSAGVVQGRDSIDSEENEVTLDVSLSKQAVLDEIEWLTVEEALTWFRSRRGMPAVTAGFVGEEPTVITTWDQYIANLEGDK